MWRLFGQSLKETYFEGVGNELVLRHDTLALQVCHFDNHFIQLQSVFPLLPRRSYYYIGQLMAASLTQGGSGFPFIYEGVYSYLCGKEPSSIPVDCNAIPEFDVQQVAKNVS